MIPLEYDLLDEKQLKYLEDYICANTEFLYVEENLFDAYILPTMYTMRTNFKSTCRAQKWANSHFRVNFYMGIGPDRKKFVGSEYNITAASAFDTSTANAGPSEPIKTDLTQMSFHNYVGFKAYFNFVFKDPMLDQKPFMAVWYSNQTDNTLYNDWTFPSMYVFDDFYYASTSRKLLTTDYMTVGKESLQST